MVGDVEENREDSDEKRGHVEIGEVEEADDSEDRDRGDHRAAAKVGEDQYRPLRPPIDPDPDQEPEQQEGNGPGGSEEPHLDLVRAEDKRGDVGDRETGELVSDPGDGLAAPQQEEVPMTPQARRRHARLPHGRPRYLSSHTAEETTSPGRRKCSYRAACLRPSGASMVKIFLDTANIDEIREAASWGVLDGVTTNPTLVAKTGRKWSEVIQDILALVDGPISLEVTTTAADEMIKQGRQLAKLHKNVVVKIQMTTEGLKAIKALSSEGVKINTTLIFSANQAILAAKAGAKYVSPFIGRLDDMGQEGMEVIREIAEIFGNYDWECEILVASIRHPLHVIEAAKLGADIVTLPFDVLKKMTQHALTDVGLKRFLDDWQKVPK